MHHALIVGGLLERASSDRLLWVLFGHLERLVLLHDVEDLTIAVFAHD